MAKKARFEDDPELNEELDQELEDTLEDEDDETSDDEEDDEDSDEEEDDEDSDDEEDEDDDDEEDEDDEDFDDEEDEDDEDSDDEEDEDFDVEALFGEEDANDNPQWDDGENWDEFTSTSWAKKLAKHPQSAFVCEWEELQGHDWAILLSKQPQLSKRCRCWENLDNEDWVELLHGQPQFASRCDWKLFKGSESQQMALIEVMKAYPEIVEACDFGQIGFSVDGWLELLKFFPHLAKQCNWYLFKTEEACATLIEWLKVLPALAKGIESAGDRFRDIHFTASAWLETMALYPTLAKFCDWSLFRNKETHPALIKLMKKHSAITEVCDFGEVEFDKDEWLRLLEWRPQLASKLFRSGDPRYMFENNEEDLIALIKKKPKIVEFEDWSDMLCDYEWNKVLEVHPEVGEHLNWNEIVKDSRMEGNYFGMFDEAGYWEPINSPNTGWASVVLPYPLTAKWCDWDSLDADDWVFVLTNRPQYAEHCDWEIFEANHWATLLLFQPQFAEHCDWEEVKDWNWRKAMSEIPRLEEVVKQLSE